jgi:hypothetical protein
MTQSISFIRRTLPRCRFLLAASILICSSCDIPSFYDGSHRSWHLPPAIQIFWCPDGAGGKQLIVNISPYNDAAITAAHALVPADVVLICPGGNRISAERFLGDDSTWAQLIGPERLTRSVSTSIQLRFRPLDEFRRPGRYELQVVKDYEMFKDDAPNPDDVGPKLRDITIKSNLLQWDVLGPPDPRADSASTRP